MTFVIIVAVLVAVLLLVVGLLALVRRGRRPADAPPIQPPVGTPPEAPPQSAPTGTLERAPPVEEEPDRATTLELDRPRPLSARLRLLRERLSRSQSTLGRGLLALLSRDRVDDETWEEIEETLLGADIGVAPTQQLVERLHTRIRVDGASAVPAPDLLRSELLELVDPTLDRTLYTGRHDGVPGVLMVVGVNGVGKTTTVGKIARVLVAEDQQVLLGAADTFRAAAADQLQTWGERVGVETIRGPEGSDPASVAFEAVRSGVEQEVDTVIVDTAGRLHTKAGLMDELGKVKRVIERQAPISEVLLVIDATTGQNGLTQARVFAEVVDVTGIVLTKLDGTAKGGIVVSVQRELGVPVKLVGLGEGADDLAPFDAAEFVDALLDTGAATPTA